jgi:poly(A) polymerase
MRKPKDDLPGLPELPSFRVEEEAPRETDAAAVERHAGTGLLRHDVTLDESRLDPDAAKVIRRLERAGFQAYLVGGCVRDLLMGGTPKDFDIATSARPEDVKGLFRNCRVIGRRFRLAHILFGGKVVEVATFRRNPQLESPEDDTELVEDDILIRSDNVFGEAHEDALRRDFTINALFYDLDRRQVLDWCGGMRDIKRRTIHTIGDPTVRFREDPVRILRAIKFAARLDLGIEPDVYDAMVLQRGELARAARPRLFEEIGRLLRGGAAHRSMWLLWEVGAMAVLLPELAAYLDDDDATDGGGERFWRRMDAIDRKIRGAGRTGHGTPQALNDGVLWTALLHEPLSESIAGSRDPVGAAYEFLEPVIERIAMPRRIADGLRRILAILPRLAQNRAGRFLRTDLAHPAIDALEIDLVARGKSTEIIERLRHEADQSAPRHSSRPPVHRGPGAPWHRPTRTARRG